MASRKGHVPGGPQHVDLKHGYGDGKVAVPEQTAPLAGTTAGDHPPFSSKRRPAAKSIGSFATDADRKNPQGNGSPGADADSRLNWSRKPPRKAQAEIWRFVLAHENTLGWRHFMALRGAAAYSSIGLGDLFENLSPYDGPKGNNWRRKGRSDFAYGGWGSKVNEGHARAAAEAVIEKLTGLRQPKTQMVGTDLEWELRRQGIWADRFIEGNMHLPQGMFSDTWDVWRQGALLSWVSTGMVAARVEPDYVGKRVRTQLRSTLNTFIDPGDVANGVPLSHFDITWENPEYMIEDPRYQGAANAWKRDAIWKASEVPPQHTSGSIDGAVFGTRMVKVVSSWRMPFGTFKGRESVSVKGAPEPIIWEDWAFPEPPLAYYRCNRCLGDSFWGENFIEIMLDPLSDAESIDEMAKNTMRLTSQTNVMMDGTTACPATMLNAKDVNFWKYDSKKGEKPPLIDKPEILNEQYFQWKREKIATAIGLSGVPDSAIRSESATHLQSGKAIRLDASLLPERFARKMRGLDQWIAVDIATRQIRAARAIGKEVPDWQVTWPGADFDSKVSVEVLNIDETQFQLRPYVVSELKNTPQERAEYAQELFDRKDISAGQLSLILDGLYDTPKETKEVDAQRVYIAKTMDDILHAPPKVVADEAAYMGNRYTPPDPWTDPPAALAQIIPVYRRAMVDGVQQNRRNLLKRLIEDVLAIQMKNAKDAAMAQANVSVKATPEQAFPTDPGAPAPAPMDMGGMGAPPPEALPQNVGGPPGIA